MYSISRLKIILSVLLLVYLCSCAPARFVKPLQKNEKAISANFGGPLISFAGAVIPMPLTAVGGGYGINDKLTAYSNIHTTSLAFGVLQLDAGVVQEVLSQRKWRPGISINPAVNLAYQLKAGDFKFWPQLDINAYWNYKNKPNYFYVGISNWFELATTRAHGEPQPHNWLFIPQFGHTFVNKKFNWNLEIKYIVPNISNKNIVVEYQAPARQGAMGFYFGVARKF
jgi:hypothetical protein